MLSALLPAIRSFGPDRSDYSTCLPLRPLLYTIALLYSKHNGTIHNESDLNVVGFAADN